MSKKIIEQEDQFPAKFLSVMYDEAADRVEVDVRGMFPPSDYIGDSLIALRKLSERCDTIYLTINSPGGVATTLVEILEVLKLFKNIITVNTGQCCSAGFLLWCTGNIRVACDYSVFIAHRESYEYRGQTGSHLDYATFSQKMFSRMFSNLCKDVLTEDEFTIIYTGNLHLSDMDMIERGACISFEEFNRVDTMRADFCGSLFDIDGEMYIKNQGLYTKIEDIVPLTSPMSEYDLSKNFLASAMVDGIDQPVSPEENDAQMQLLLG